MPVASKLSRLIAAQTDGPSPRRAAPALRPAAPYSKAFEKLEERRMLSTVDLPYRLDFDTALAGTLTDGDGQGTGFTTVQQNAAGNAHLPGNLDLDPSAGLLSITTTGSSTTGSNVRSDDTLRNALATQFDATSAFEVTARIVGEGGGTLAQLNERYEQVGIMLGPDSDHFVKLVALYHDSGPRLQFTDEWLQPDGSYVSGGEGLLFAGSWDTVTTLDLRLAADPSTGQVTASFRVNGGAWQQTPNTITVPTQHRAETFSETGQAGVLAFHRNNTGPITVSFDWFEVERVVVGPED
ncbi:MAG: hypothetical protein AAGK78_12755, partial [Planctomycetota bacterium]